MKSFQKMLQAVSSSPHHDRMMRFVEPLNDLFGINHFWYYKITSRGDYCYFGTHAAWSEYCFDRELVACFPCLRHPDTLQSGISLMKSCSDVLYKNTLQTAWDRFGINFNVNLLQKLSNGVEAFGFASRFHDAEADERVLNELPSLRQFINVFREKHSNIFNILENHQVNIADSFGEVFYERAKSVLLPQDRKQFLQKLGCGWILTLTPREKDLMHMIASGYPASHISEQLGLSKRTVENYLAVLKNKLFCDSKVELIQKAKEFVQLN